jgi:predicted nucleic acid-binding protein
MIFVGSSVWIDYFNGKASRETDYLDELLGVQLLATGELVLTEVLQGFRVDADYLQAKQMMLNLEQVSMLNTDIAIKSAENFRTLRKRGLTVRKTIDVIIATVCIEQDLSLLHADKDFQPFHEYLGLRNALPSR